jgi:hypothetical protein
MKVRSSRKTRNVGFEMLYGSLFPLDIVSDCVVYFLLQLTFSGAIIEVCMRKLVFYPEVVGFLEEGKDDFPYVETRYSYGSPPKLVMLDDKGEEKETIRQVPLNSRTKLLS